MAFILGYAQTLAGKVGHDPTTYGLTDRRYYQLSYSPICILKRKRGGRFYPVREAPSELKSSNARYSGYWRSLGAVLIGTRCRTRTSLPHPKCGVQTFTLHPV